MQNAKDSFYGVLRDRLAGLNPERTVVVRGVTRPAVVVDENEATSVAAQADCFHLHWTGATVGEDGAMPLIAMTCEISYATAGSSWNGGLDRGRVLAAMDAELLRAVGTYPQNVAKRTFAAEGNGGAATAMNSRVWWSDLSLSPTKATADQITRTATVQVMCFEEDGEL